MHDPYCVKLKDFEGSLDLLLHLVRSAKMDIMTIHLSEITDQYLEYMAQIHEIDMDRASDFLETASILLLIKSRSLLPQAPKQEENDDPEMELKERLRLYEIFQMASQLLIHKEEIGPEHFYRTVPQAVEEDDPSPLPEMDAEDLRKAFVEILSKRKEPPKKEEKPVHTVQQEIFSVHKQKKVLLELLMTCKATTFRALFSKASTREEIVVTFSALLELWAAGQVQVSQRRPFSTIEIRLQPLEVPA